jgi:diadenosine tetraphosphate (Ap4A) HIT family hydrolase
LAFNQLPTLIKELTPDSHTIGINDGEAAGQTVTHVPIHLIPRYKGDTEDPMTLMIPKEPPGVSLVR